MRKLIALTLAKKHKGSSSINQSENGLTNPIKSGILINDCVFDEGSIWRFGVHSYRMTTKFFSANDRLNFDPFETKPHEGYLPASFGDKGDPMYRTK